MNDAMGEKEISSTLKRLAREEFLSEEKYQKLAELEDFDSSKLIDVIKETKIGQGLKFLPRKLTDLSKNLQLWLEELVETGSSVVKKKVAAVLEELLRRKAISHERYTSIKEDNVIM